MSNLNGDRYRFMEVIMSISINNNSYDYSMIIIKGVELEATNSVSGNAESKPSQKVSKAEKVDVTIHTSTCPEGEKSYVSGETTKTVTKSYDGGERKDYFITNYNDLVAKNFGLIFDTRV